MDERLVKAIKEMADGKESGFNVVYSETHNHVYFRAKQHMNSEEDALDLTQVVFVEAFKGIGSLQTPEALYGWLDRITYNQGMKMYRKNKEVLLTEEGEFLFDELESNDIAGMPEISVEQKETSKIIREIIEELPEAQRVALIAYYFDHFSVGQIAEMEECSEGTIKSRLNYARKYIKDRIEEKEKKEGYRLHALALPTLLWAIRFMADDTTMSAEAAQAVYSGACSQVGLHAGVVTVSGRVLSKMATKSGAGAGTVKASTGIGSGFAALSGGVKALIIASTIGIAGAGVAGGVYLANSGNNEVIEESVVVEAPDTDYVTDIAEQDTIVDDSIEEANIEPALTITDAEKNQIGVAISFAEEYDLLNRDSNYVFNTRYYIDMVMNGREGEEGLLPLNWNSNVVSEDDVKTFWKDGFGIDIPDGYSYSDNTEFWGNVTCTSERSWDISLERLTVTECNVTDNADGTYTVSGILAKEDMFEGGAVEKTFTAICELSGNPDIFGGYRIIGLGDNAAGDAKIDFDDIAKKYAEVAAGADPYDVGAARDYGFDMFYIDDINSDGIPEFLMPTPYADEASKEYLIYSYKDGEVYKYGAIPGGHVMKLFGYYDSDNLIYEWIQSGYNGACIASPAGGEVIDIYNYMYQDNDEIVPTFAGTDGAYEMKSFSDLSVDGIRNELKRFQ